jgi:type VI protein secretion system component VasA
VNNPRFHISAIKTALKDFQAEFLTINENLAMKREDVSDDMVNQIVEAYVFLNGLLQKGMNLFTPAGMHSLLEMNHIVLCGAIPISA